MEGRSEQQIFGTGIEVRQVIGTENGSTENGSTENGSTEPKRKRGRPKGSTTTQAPGSDQSGKEEKENQADPVLVGAQPPVIKPKRSHHKKTTPKADIKDLTENIAQAVQGIFALVAARAGEYWQVSHEEALKVAAPAARILDRLDLSGRASAYSDYIALAVALFGIIAPRLFMAQLQKPAENKREVPRLVRTDNRNDNSKRTPDHSDQSDQLKYETSHYNNGDFANVIDQIIGG
jgi:hypothetical protein